MAFLLFCNIGRTRQAWIEEKEKGGGGGGGGRKGGEGGGRRPYKIQHIAINTRSPRCVCVHVYQTNISPANNELWPEQIVTIRRKQIVAWLFWCKTHKTGRSGLKAQM